VEAADTRATTRLAAIRPGVAALVGVAVGIGVSLGAPIEYAPATGWIAAAIVYLSWTWITVGRMSPQRTASHATREDPTQTMTDSLMVAASLASLLGVGLVLMAGSKSGGEADIAAAVGFGAVVAAWLIVHSVFTLRYARLYYQGPQVGGIDFNQDEDPAYADFAYLAFTLGMTYQVSDTDLQTRTIRATALRQALLSYLLGAVILATTINLIAGLGNSHH
jgi:uncharacterized membrane protein